MTMDIDHIPNYIACGLDSQTDRVVVRVYDTLDDVMTLHASCAACLSAEWLYRANLKIALAEGFPWCVLPDHIRSEALSQYRDIIAIYDALDKFHASITPNNNQ